MAGVLAKLRDWMLPVEADVTEAVHVTPWMRRIRLSGVPARPDVPPAAEIKIDVSPTRLAPPRAFTVYRHDPKTATVDLLAYLHGSGPAARWAASAGPGDVVRATEPEESLRVDGSAGWHLFAGDETAIAAILAMSAVVPAGQPVVACIEVDEPLPLQAVRPSTQLMGEARAIQAIRRWLRTDLGWDRRQIHVRAHWALGRTALH